jgi:hypothetical protein
MRSVCSRRMVPTYRSEDRWTTNLGDLDSHSSAEHRGVSSSQEGRRVGESSPWHIRICDWMHPTAFSTKLLRYRDSEVSDVVANRRLFIWHVIKLQRAVCLRRGRRSMILRIQYPERITWRHHGSFRRPHHPASPGHVWHHLAQQCAALRSLIHWTAGRAAVSSPGTRVVGHL